MAPKMSKMSGDGDKGGKDGEDKKENQPSSSSGGYEADKTTDETIALLLQMMEDLNINETSAEQIKKMETGLKSLTSRFKNKDKVVKTEEEKIADAKAKAAKYAKARKDKTASEREAVMTLTVRFKGVSHTIVLRGKHGVGRIRSTLAEILNMKKDTKFIFTCRDIDFNKLDPTKTLRLAGIRDGDIIDAVLPPSTAAGVNDVEDPVPSIPIGVHYNIDDDISGDEDEEDDMVSDESEGANDK